MKKLFQICLAAAFVFGAPAHATLINSSASYNVTGKLAEAGSYDFFRTIDTAASALGQQNNFFSDKYTFDLAAAAFADGQMTSIRFSNGTGLVITDFNLHSTDGALVFSGDLDDIEDQSWYFENAALSKGSYVMEVNGYATAVKGSYSGTLTVTAVPEPGSLALMLGGLAVLGLAARRRA